MALQCDTLSLLEAGRQADAFALWRGADAADEDIGWLVDRSTELMHAADLTLAGEFARLAVSLRRGSRWFPCPTPDDPSAVDGRFLTIHKLRHDIEQLEYLIQLGVLGTEFAGVARGHRDVLEQLCRAGHGPDDRVPFDADAEAEIGDAFGRIVHLRDEPRLPHALSESWDGPAVTRRYLDNGPGLVVVDDFLTPEALAGVQRFCTESTVWFANRYANGRLGAFFHEGFNCPLLLQIAEELRATMPDLLGGYTLRQLWGYKNKAFLPGDTTTHADFAAVNVNFWITPSEANLDENGGGLVVYGVDAPPDWNFPMYNGRADLIRPFLASRNAASIVIPYRANRAIIFNSDLFHATAEVRFREGYQNRRVNVTMLYGERDDDRHHPRLSRHQLATGRGTFRPAWRSRARRQAR